MSPAAEVKLSSDKAAAVNPGQVYYCARQRPPPLNCKLLCINAGAGVATVSQWCDWFTHWAPLPVLPEGAERQNP